MVLFRVCNINEINCRFDAKLNKWTTVAPMLESRFSHAAAVLCGKIYVVGGFKVGIGYLDSVECYNPITNAWTRLGSLNVKRGSHGCCSVNGLLYAIGGASSCDRLHSIEKYDQMINKWTMIESRLEIPRSRAGMAVLDNWVCIAGGRVSEGDGTELEKINLVTGERTKLTHMHHKPGTVYLCQGTIVAHPEVK